MVYDSIETDVAGTLILAGDENGLRHLNFAGGKYPVAVDSTWQRDPNHFAAVKAPAGGLFCG